MNKIYQTVVNIYIIIILTTIVFGLCIVFLPFVLIFGRKKASPVLNNFVTVPFSRFSNRFLFRCNIEVIGNHNIPPREKKHALISNHLSFFDISAFMDVLQSTFIMKKSIIYIFPYGTFAYFLGSITVNRINIRDLKYVSNTMVEFIRAGIKIHLFPEGTRSRDDELLPFKKGLLHKLYNENIPVLCCAIWNSQKVMPPDNMDLRKIDFKKTVYISVGRLIDPSDYDKFDVFFENCFNEVKTQLNKAKQHSLNS